VDCFARCDATAGCEAVVVTSTDPVLCYRRRSVDLSSCAQGDTSYDTYVRPSTPPPALRPPSLARAPPPLSSRPPSGGGSGLSSKFVAPWRGDGRCRFARNERQCFTYYAPKAVFYPCLVWQGCAYGNRSADACQRLCAQRADCRAYEFNNKNLCGASPCELHGVVPTHVDADPRYTCKIKA